MDLDETQRSVLDSVTSAIADPCLRGRMLILGEAGTGKSLLLREICQCTKGLEQALICPTGAAAENLQLMLGSQKPTPQTAHSFFHMSQHQTVEETIETICKFHPKLVAKICDRNFILIIDELPMMSCTLLGDIQHILRTIRIRNNPKGSYRDLPWGGVWVIMSGDCFQLPPVSKISLPHCGCEIPAFFFLHKEWHRMVDRVVLLETIHRQEDQDFIRFLSEIRRRMPGEELSEHAQRFLHDLQMKSFEELEEREEEERRHGIQLAHLCPTKKAVAEINEEQVRWLMKQKREARKFPVYVSRISDDPAYHKGLVEKLTGRLNLDHTKDTVLEYTVVGSQVRFTYNLATGKGVSNGTMGVVVGFDDPDSQWCQQDLLLSNDRRRRPVSESRGKGFPVVKVRKDQDTDMLVLAAPHTIRETIMDGSNRRVLAFIEVEIIPMVHGVATTVHSSQGMTLQRGVISLNNCFDHGMGYVAFSRFKTRPSVFHCDPDNIVCSPLAGEFYSRILEGDLRHGAISTQEITRKMLRMSDRDESEPPQKRQKV